MSIHTAKGAVTETDAGAGKWAPLSGLLLVVAKRAAQAGFPRLSGWR